MEGATFIELRARSRTLQFGVAAVREEPLPSIRTAIACRACDRSAKVDICILVIGDKIDEGGNGLSRLRRDVLEYHRLRRRHQLGMSRASPARLYRLPTKPIASNRTRIAAPHTRPPLIQPFTAPAPNSRISTIRINNATITKLASDRLQKLQEQSFRPSSIRSPILILSVGPPPAPAAFSSAIIFWSVSQIGSIGL